MKFLWRALIMFVLFIPGFSQAATQQEIKQAVNDGLAYLASSMTTIGDEGYWPYSNDGTLAATAAAVTAFVEEEYLPGKDVVIGGTNYGDVVGKACKYIFNRAKVDSRFTTIGPGGLETAGYTRYAEDYNNDGVLNDGGNNQAIFFNPGNSNRNVYTTGIVVPAIYALGKALGPDTEVGMGPVTSSMTYREVMRDVFDWFSWGQVEPNYGNQRGGWRYDANYSSSDNSTAQWAALTIIYGKNWGLSIPQYVKDELKLWTDYIQNDNGGSGYSYDYEMVDESKTGGLLLQFYVLGYKEGVSNSDTPFNSINNEVDAAISYLNSNWNNFSNNTWYGNINHPYAMWAIYKALQLYNKLEATNFYPGDNGEITIGKGIPSAPGGYTIGQDWGTYSSLPGDWYSHYCDYLVSKQNPDGLWSGYSYWYGPLATSWYINILKATPVTASVNPTPQNVRLTVGKGMAFLTWTSDASAENVTFKVKFAMGNPPAESEYRDYCAQNNCDDYPVETFEGDWAVVEKLEKDATYGFKIVAVVNGVEYPSAVVIGKIPPYAMAKIENPFLLIPGTGGKWDAWEDMKPLLEGIGFKLGGILILEEKLIGQQFKIDWKDEIGKPNEIGDFYICSYENASSFHYGGPIADNYEPTRVFVDEIRRVEEELDGEKRIITLVGQSLGGLRARAYLQKKNRAAGDETVKEKINKLITIGTPNLGVLQDHAHYEKADIYGAWRIIMGNASETEGDFFHFWQLEDEDYKFEGGYINDINDRYDGDFERNKLHVQRLMEGLRDGHQLSIGRWDFTKQALQQDVVAGSSFMSNLNYWIESDCQQGESEYCSFYIKPGCENGDCENNEFIYLPDIEYRYVVAKNPEGKLYLPPKWIQNLGFKPRDARWYNYFMFKNSNDGDGFISTKSQDFKFVHLAQNINKAKSIYRPGKNHATELRDHIGLLEALDFPIVKFIVKCPVDLSIESPSGLRQAVNISEILGATYNEADVNGDGRLDRFIEVPFPKHGDYKITVIPKEGADPNDTFTLEVEVDGEVTVLVENKPVGTIDGTPIIVNVGGNVPPIANAGADRTVERTSSAGASVTLDGSGSSDPDGDALTYTWNWGGGSASGVTPTITLPMGLSTVTLTVSDGQTSSIDTVDINVVDTTSPTVSIIIPDIDDAVQDGVTLTASASDLSGIASVSFFVREPGGTSGIPIGKENLAGTFDSSTGKWKFNFDSTQLQDGYYVVLAKAADAYGNEGWSAVVPFSIRNWAVIKLLPASENNKAGRTMPVKFALRVTSSVDPKTPFVYNEDLEIRIYDKAYPGVILQTCLCGSGSKDYRINTVAEKYIANFQTKRQPAEYVVEIWRINKNWLVGSFTFKTVK